MCYVTVISAPMKVDESVQIKNKKRPKFAKERQVLRTVAEILRTDHNKTSVDFHRIKENGSTELVLSMTLS